MKPSPSSLTRYQTPQCCEFPFGWCAADGLVKITVLIFRSPSSWGARPSWRWWANSESTRSAMPSCSPLRSSTTCSINSCGLSCPLCQWGFCPVSAARISPARPTNTCMCRVLSHHKFAAVNQSNSQDFVEVSCYNSNIFLQGERIQLPVSSHGWDATAHGGQTFHPPLPDPKSHLR